MTCRLVSVSTAHKSYRKVCLPKTKPNQTWKSSNRKPCQVWRKAYNYHRMSMEVRAKIIRHTTILKESAVLDQGYQNKEFWVLLRLGIQRRFSVVPDSELQIFALPTFIIFLQRSLFIDYSSLPLSQWDVYIDTHTRTYIHTYMYSFSPIILD